MAEKGTAPAPEESSTARATARDAAGQRPAARLAQSVAADLEAEPIAAPEAESPTMIMRVQRFFRLALLVNILLVIFVLSMLTAMRFAIHGREVKVPKVIGLRPEQAETALADKGLVLEVQDRFYSSEIGEGRLMTQVPAADATVRRGYKVRAAVSLGPQRAVVPDVLGESSRAAEINIQRRGLEIGTVAVIHAPEFPPDQVIAQSPSAATSAMKTPKVGLLVSASAEEESYIMPDFTGRRLADVSSVVQQAGFTIARIANAGGAEVDASKISPSSSPIVVKQSPLPGSRVTTQSSIVLEISN